MRRRTFLKISSGALLSSVASATGLITFTPRAEAATLYKTFDITEGFIQQADGVNVYFRGFSGNSNSLHVPGEVLVMQAGDTYSLTIRNNLNSDHSFVINELGVNTSIPAGRTRTVTITANQPGTYMYYDAVDYPDNRLVGLHGALVVFPSGTNTTLESGRDMPKQEFVWMFNDIDPAWNNAIRNNNNTPNSYTPRYFSLNGLYGRPPGAPGAMDPALDSMADKRTAIYGHLGDRTMVRCLNAGKAQHAVHCHGNHMEWISSNGKQRDHVWKKDIIPLDGDGGTMDFIFPFEPPPDAWPVVTNNTLAQAEADGRHFTYPMHLHDEMTQTSGGGLYMFGALTDIYFKA